MFVVPSTLQLLVAVVVLFVLGVCGNLMVPFLSYRATLRCPHTTFLTTLDFTATLFSPGLMFVTLTTGPAWLEHKSMSLCQTLRLSKLLCTDHLLCGSIVSCAVLPKSAS